MLDYSKIFDDIRDLYAFPAYNFTSCNVLLPLRYFLELTYRCNLQCPYCYVGNDRQKQELSTEQWKNIIRQIPRYSFVTLVGGEPLLRLDFGEILHDVSKRVFSKTSLVTNGYLLSDDIIKILCQNKMTLLSVSLDGYGKNHDLNRCKEGLFDVVAGNLDNLKNYNSRPKIDIKTIILENNLEDLPKLYKHFSDFEFFSLAFLRVNDLKQNSVLRDDLGSEFYELKKRGLYFDMEHFKEVYKELKSLEKKSKCKIRFAPKFEYINDPLKKIEEFFTKEKDFKDSYKPCKYPFSNMCITPEGLVYPCLSVKMGDLKKNTLNEIFNMPCYKNFRKKIKKEGFLPSCDMCCELCVI